MMRDRIYASRDVILSNFFNDLQPIALQVCKGRRWKRRRELRETRNSGSGAGGVLVPEAKIGFGRGEARGGWARWQRGLFFLGLTAALAILSSCGSSNSSVTPTITVSCTPTDVTVLSTSQCTATVLNESSTLVNWSVSSSSSGGATAIGSITAGGLYTAPATVPTNNVVTVTATSQVSSTLTATQSLTLEPATQISAVTCLDPNTNVASSVVSSGNQLACTATASTGATVAVNWSVTNANSLGGNVGTVSVQGIYTAPLVPPPGSAVTITATSQSLSTITMSVNATVVFGNNVLSGPYAFSTTGRLTNSSFWARVGSFTTGGGALTGIEDTNQGGSPNTVTTQRTFSGSYSIGPDGRGTMQFCEGTSSSCPIGSPAATAFFRIAVVSPAQAELIEFSNPTTSSAAITAGGEMLSQDSAIFTARDGALSGVYSFNFSGVSTSATDESAVGEFAANGFGTINAGSTSAPLAPGEMDINPGGTTTLASTSYSISSNGRGTVTLGGLTFSFYPVSASRSKFIEIDSAVSPSTTPASILAGDAYIQQNSASCAWGLTSLSGATVLETTGSSSGVVVQDLGSFTASNGNISAASLDQNSGGAVTLATTTGAQTGSYTMNPCGRGTMTIGSHSYVFYIISSSNAVLQEITSGVVGYGMLAPSQGGPLADSTFTGSYAFRLGGTDAAGTAGSREDLVGQVTSNGSGAGIAGTVDLNVGATQTGLAINNGGFLPNPSGTLRATMSFPIASSPSVTRTFAVYMVSPKIFYFLDIDSAPAGTALGVINNQF